MTSADIRTLLKTEPFEPFTMHMVDGRRVTVQHPEFCALNPVSRTMVMVFDADGVPHYLNTTLIIRITHDLNGRHRRRKAG